MGVIKALLVGISEYPTLGCSPLPLCKNDIYALRSALINGLNVDKQDILLCGETGNVTSSDLICSINSILSTATNEDTFIFYFSGHGAKNCLVLSNEIIELQDLISTIENVNTKNKIFILDSCHAGSFSIDGIPQMDITETVESFAGHGYAVLASCGAEEVSGFNHNKQISLYTSFVCDALTSNFLISKGKKSLEAINETIFRFAELCNKSGKYHIQQPIFRANLGGTIFFDVEEYNPYKITQIYEETDNYIIYAVEPIHNATAKKLDAKVILRYQCSKAQIADIVLEIQKKFLFLEVHQNEIAEARHKGKAANIIRCYFGYDEDDIVDGNFVYHTIWVDDAQDKRRFYHPSNNKELINGVYITTNVFYERNKESSDYALRKDEFIRVIREYSSRLISAAEEYINIYREYENKTLTEEQLIDKVTPLNNEISLWFLKQTELPKPPKKLHDWAHVHANISCTIHDFSLFYNRKYLDNRSSENRKRSMSDAIKRYEIELEELKAIDRAN